MNLFKLLLVVFVIGIFTETFGHSYLTNPISRSNQKQSQTGCRGPNCLGPCERPASQAANPITIARGQSISVEWPRNNHAGGFIRIAWAQTSQSDSHSAFDNNIQEFSCHERGGCKPDSPSNPNGGDSGPSDGSSNPCKLSITVPTHLSDGLWTMQWAWFGGAFALGDYYSCVDYKISGGSLTSKADVFFVGGDYTYPNQQKCKYFNTDRLHACVNEPCNNIIYPGERSGIPLGVSNNNPIPVTTSKVIPTEVTTSKVIPTQITTSKVIPTEVTTSKVIPTPNLTTSKQNTPSSTSTSTSGGNSDTLMCYKPGTPNINGKVNRNSGKCGKNDRNARCAEGQCCSKFGYCGYSSYYCADPSADYRKYTCASLGLTESNADGEKIDVVDDDLPIETSSASKYSFIGISSILAVLVLLQ